MDIVCLADSVFFSCLLSLFFPKEYKEFQPGTLHLSDFKFVIQC